MKRGVVRGFHRTLNTASGVVAAGIVLGGGYPREFSSPMGLALALFIVGFVGGVLLLRLLDWSSELQRHGLGTLLLIAALRDTGRHDAGTVVEAAPRTPVPLTVLTVAAGLLHMAFVAGGFALVAWSLVQDVVV